MDINQRYQTVLKGTECRRVGAAVLVWVRSKVLLDLRSDCYYWGLPGGKAEDSELPIDAALRELREETSINLSRADLHFLDIFDDPEQGRVVQYHDNRVHLIDHVFLAVMDDYPPLKMSDESVQLKFFGLTELPSNIVPPAREILERLHEQSNLLY